MVQYEAPMIDPRGAQAALRSLVGSEKAQMQGTQGTFPPRGFTLLDILLAILVMTVGFVGLQMVQIVGFRANSLSREITEANNVARMKLEELKGLYDVPRNPATVAGVNAQHADQVDPRGCVKEVVTVGNVLTGDPFITPDYCAPPQTGTEYTRRWLVDATGQIFVEVYWDSADGRTHYVELYDVR